MHRHFFRRSKVIIPLFNAIYLVVKCIMCLLMFVAAMTNETVIIIGAIIAVAIYFAIKILLEGFIPEDFEYDVRVKKDYIIFAFGEYDHRSILRKYYEVSRKHGRMVLQDNIDNIISIPYNQEVLEFLEQVRIE